MKYRQHVESTIVAARREDCASETMTLVADIEGHKVRLSANANVAVTMEQH